MVVSIRYFPLLSVVVPTVVPLRTTETKGSTSPVLASVTTPFIIVFSVAENSCL
jgi:hypothetical protein